MKTTVRKKQVEYFRRNWGAPFVMLFMALLVTAAAYLSMGSETVANYLATFASYLRVAGVALQVASSVKYRGRENE